MRPDPSIPTDAELLAYAAGQLSPDQCARIETYLESHPDSKRRCEELSIDDHRFAKTVVSSNEHPISGVHRVLQSGTSVGRYVIREPLGQGGMGVVYRAHDPVIDREVALKVLPGGNDAAADRALAEARAQGQLNHPHIVIVHDADRSQYGVFIAMELMSHSIDDLLRKSGPQSVDIATRHLLAAIEGLHAAHEVGLIHRDIKPANLLLSAGGTVKVADFGLARTVDDETLTGNAPLAGTPHFMSPEQCRAEKIDVRTDVYALGATFYTLLTGSKPYSNSTSAMQVLFAQCKAPPPDPCSIRSDLPSSCSDIITRAMAKRREDRFSGVEELGQALRTIGENGQSTTGGLDGSRIWKKLTAIPTGPSLAVLPLANLNNDPEQEFFCDGITEEIITALARFRELRVIARNSTNQYKGQAVDVRRIGEELDVDFVIEGSIRRSAQRIRVTAQLVEAQTGSHVWTETYDRDLSAADLFDIQDDVAQRVAAAVGHPVGAAFQSRRQAVLSKEAESLEAYELVLRWYEHLRKATPNTHIALRDRLEQVTKKGCDLADVWGALSFLYLDEVRGGVERRTDSATLDEAMAAADRAVTIDPNSVIGNWALFCIHFHRHELAEFRSVGRRAITLNPNHPDLLADYALCIGFLGEWQRAVALTEKAISLSPGNAGWYHGILMVNHFRLGEYAEALSLNRQLAIDGWFWSPLFLAASHGLLGNTEPARAAIADLLEVHPDFPQQWQHEFAIWNIPDEVRDPLVRGLENAGLTLVSK